LRMLYPTKRAVLDTNPPRNIFSNKLALNI
jgi:hypothetical protein